MKFLVTISALIAAVAAQNAFIYTPASGDVITAGDEFLVTITKPVCLALSPIRRT